MNGLIDRQTNNGVGILLYEILFLVTYLLIYIHEEVFKIYVETLIIKKGFCVLNYFT